MSSTQYPVYTVGHSTHSWAEFVKLLLRHRIDAVFDVRSAPFSRYATHFNYDQLRQSLEIIGIAYEFLGDELGGRPADRSCYDSEGQVRYDQVAATDFFDEGIGRVVRRADECRVVLLCTEKEPLDCHRTLLVARELKERSVEVDHILWDGNLENHSTSMDRLLDLFNLSHLGDMFQSKDDTIGNAINLQAKKVAHVNVRGRLSVSNRS